MKIKHPGKTISQRRLLDAIGCGKHNPSMTNPMRQRMIEMGLIERIADIVFPYPLTPLKQFDMPPGVRVLWCDFHAQAEDGEAKVQK